MKLTYNSKLATITASHNGDEAHFNVSAYSRASRADDNTIFEHINDLWSKLPQTKQDKIFKIYQNIYEIFETTSSIDSLFRDITALVHEMYELMPYDTFTQYTAFNANIPIPATVDTDYGPYTSRDKTYLVNDYRDLMAMVIALRPMIPIWGEAIRSISDDTVPAYKEYLVMRLLSASWVDDSVPMHRLYTFIDSSVTDSWMPPSAIYGGLGTSELPDYLLALCVVRRAAVCDVYPTSDGSHIVTNIYSFLFNNALNSLDRKFDGRVIEKDRTRDSGSDEESKLSVVEAHKVKQPVSDGDIVVLGVFSEDIIGSAEAIDPTVPRGLVRQCCTTMRKLRSMEISPINLNIARYVVGKAITPRGIPQLRKNELMNIYGITMALLTHWEMYDLAVLMASEPADEPDRGYGGNVMQLESRSRIPKAMIERILEIYPMYHQTGGRASTLEQKKKAGNITLNAIDALAKSMSMEEWVSHAPSDLMDKSSFANQKYFLPPGDLKVLLATLVIKLSDHQDEEAETI